MLSRVGVFSLCRPRFSTSAARRTSPTGGVSPGPTGSAKLFADATREETEQIYPSHSHEQPEEHVWNGDERLQDTVLRMLMDKYKPLRTGTIQTAEQKLHKSAPNVQQYRPDTSHPPITPSFNVPPGGSWASVPLLPPGPPDHRPWHTEFKVPEHAKASIRHARYPVAAPVRATHKDCDDVEQTQRNEKELHKTLGRLSRARESTLDYRLGLNSGSQSKQARARLNPVSVKGWTSLVEDRIEKARRAGLFAATKGRGKPIVRTADENNPFIAREEFLMNRIVRRNGAAPPWVELQGELDHTLHTFRRLLLDGWTRHAVRALTTNGISPAAHASSFRDPKWAAREAAYHAAALAEVNDRVRRYNALAPYAVRRPLYTLEAELAGAYERAVEGIARGLADRAKAQETKTKLDKRVQLGVGELQGKHWGWMQRLRDLLLGVVKQLARLVRARTR
ncbi:hypothetical protein GGX14DRAFT_634857 [Mycena pura]|uniref:DnaJ homologue subfamily C member 28 conserved domain-containing protein n=1 Tax=Mycena pura TaxID=153505 RepID=A0AAD6VIJ5_9AGAR|nr:hypothetical protein GGX14DRAFT_634857 [Mycena pura]